MRCILPAAGGIDRIGSLDNVYLLVFVRGNGVVASELAPLNLADFHLADFHEAPDRPREQAVLEFTGKENFVALVSSGSRNWRSFCFCEGKLPLTSWEFVIK